MYYKYPSTYHLPWSPHNKRDDKKLKDTTHFDGREVILTEKMDGENTTMYSDHIHARSINSADHPSRSWVKKLHGEIKHLIPDGVRICGENMYAKHSILYQDLPSYFLVFSIWVDDLCLSWDDTEDYCEMLGLKTVWWFSSGPWIPENEECYRRRSDNWDEWSRKSLGHESEGYVARVSDSFKLEDWTTSIAKWVRPEHINTTDHWMNQALIVNGLKN